MRDKQEAAWPSRQHGYCALFRNCQGQQLLRDLGCALDASNSSQTGARAQMARLVAALQASPVRSQIEQRLAEIDMMSDWLGEACLREAVRDEAPGLFDALMREEGAHKRAALVQSARPAVFERACRRRYFSRYQLLKKACARFRAPSRGDWTPSNGTLESLGRIVEPLLHQQLRTGQGIIVDPIIRNSPGAKSFVQLSLYAAGSAQCIEEVEGDSLVQKVIRPAFVCVIGYWPKTGNLEIVVRNGTLGLRKAIAQAFVEVALAASADDVETMVEPTVTLDGLLARQVLGFDVEDKVVAARLIELEVRSMARSGAAIILVARDRQGDVWDTATEFVKDTSLLAGIVTRAKIRVEYIVEGSSRPRPLTFEFSPPHGYTPRGETEMQILVIQKYLPRWGILTAEEGCT